LVKNKFVALAVDARSRELKDSEAEFLRTADCVTKTAAGSVYIVTASGKNLGYCSLIPDGKSFPASLEQKLKAWRTLPGSERAPDAFQVPDKSPSDAKRLAQTPPKDCLIVRVFNRQLGRGLKGELRYTVPSDYVPTIRQGAARFAEPANDYLWIAKAEWQALMPANPKPGVKVPVPTALCERLFRHHLDPAHGFGESENFTLAKAGSGKLTLIIEDVGAATVRMRLEGDADLKRDRGSGYQQGGPISYSPHLLGYLAYDPAKMIFTRFDVVALGDATGRPLGENNMGERPGANPLGIAFELVTNPTPVDQTFPRGARDNAARYLGK
jgi:hypothetical protein